MSMSDIGERIRVAREAAGLSQYTLAVACGVQTGQVWRWEKGRAVPSAVTIGAVARALGVSADALIGGAE